MKNIKYIVMCIILLLVDQFSKFIVSSNMELYQEKIVIDNFFSILYIRNDGAAFSMLSGFTWFFYVITAIGLVVVYYLYKNSSTKVAKIATFVLLAGILGNFIDRLLFKEVIDFISVTFFSHNFAIFNFADIYITIAVILFICDVIFNERKVK